MAKNAVDSIERLTVVGNVLGLDGRFGVKWGFVQLRARLNALHDALMDDDEPPVEYTREYLGKGGE